MASAWKTKSIIMAGGTRLDIEPVLRDAVASGSLFDSQNIESGEKGGYKRLKGYSLWESAVVPGTGRVLGCFVHNDGVLACRGSAIYFSSGTGWGADIAPSSRAGALQYRATKYIWSSGECITLVDGDNAPVRFIGAVGTNLTNAPVAATCVREFKNHLFFGKGGTVTFSAPDDDTTYTAGAGGGAFVIGDTIQNFAAWRDKLVIFCENSIHLLTGNDNGDFAIQALTGHTGCDFPDSVQEVGGDVVFSSPEGLRTISATVQTVELGLYAISNPIKSFIRDSVEDFMSGRICSTVVENKSQYRLFFADESTAAASCPGVVACLTAGQEGSSWEFFKSLGFKASCADHGAISSGADELVIHGDYDGYVYQQESGDSFNTADIEAFFQLGYLVFDDPAIRKIYHRVRLYVEVEGGGIATLTGNLYLDDNDPDSLQPQPASLDLISQISAQVAIYGFTGGSNGGSKYGTAVYGHGVGNNYRVGLVGAGFNMSLKIASSDTKPAWAIKTAIIEYSLGARQ